MNSGAARTEMTIFTIGHSNHPLETFLALLQQQQLTRVVDVRSSPYSGYASQFNREAIRVALRARGIEYLFLGDLLGGRPEGRQFYDAGGHVLYDRVAASAAFTRGIDRLCDHLPTGRVTLLCGEEDPTHCHRRRLVGRVLGRRGVGVLHIRGDGRLQSEEELAKEETFRKTKGQMTLFDLEEPESWKSTQSVLPGKAPPNSSSSSSGPESGA